MKRKIIFLFLFAIEFEILSFNLVQEKMNNGLEVIFIENNSVPLVTIKLIVKAGAFIESDEYDGLSHLYEHMFFKANKMLPSQEDWIKYTRAHGMKWNGATSKEYVDYYFIVHKKNLLPAIKLMYASIQSPLFDQLELEKERKVVLSEYDDGDSDPMTVFWNEVGKKTYGKFFSYKNIIGNRKIIESATREKLLYLRNKYFIPNNSLLIIAGDINPSKLYKKIEPIFSTWEKGGDPFAPPLPKIPKLKKDEFVLVTRDVKLATLKLLFNGPGVFTNKEATYAADVLSYCLDHLNSTFHKELIETGIAQSASFGYQTFKIDGEIYFYLSLKPENIKKALKVLKKQLAGMYDLKTYINKDLIDEALSLHEIEELYSRESSMNFADKIGFWWSVSDIDYYFKYLENLKKVSYSDMQSFFDTYIKKKPFVGAVLISKEDQKKYNIDANLFEGVFK